MKRIISIISILLAFGLVVLLVVYSVKSNKDNFANGDSSTSEAEKSLSSAPILSHPSLSSTETQKQPDFDSDLPEPQVDIESHQVNDDPSVSQTPEDIVSKDITSPSSTDGVDTHTLGEPEEIDEYLLYDPYIPAH